MLNAKQINAPNSERLNEIVKLLKAKNFKREILDLREAFYARTLALKKYDLPNFKGLIDAGFEKGETEKAIELLELTVKISFEATSETALASFHSLKAIKETSPEKPELYEILPENKPDAISALNLAAEISAKFGQFARAINFRKKLLAIQPKNNLNKIELARLTALDRNFDEAIKSLASIITDRNAERSERWQALFTAQEINGNDGNLWQILKNNLFDLKARDAEMWKAFEASALAQTGNLSQALQILGGENEKFQTAETLFLKAVIAKNFVQNEIALKAFSKIKNATIDFDKTFGFAQEKPLFQMIRLYSIGGKPLAALKLIKADEIGKSSEDGVRISDFGFQTLAERSAENYEKSLTEILEILSKDAEKTGDLQKALELEKRRIERLSDKIARQNSVNRIAELEQKIYRRRGKTEIYYRVDENLVSK